MASSTSSTMSKKMTYRCLNCGSDQVETLYMVNPNTMEVGQRIGRTKNWSSNHCNNCQSSPELEQCLIVEGIEFINEGFHIDSKDFLELVELLENFVKSKGETLPESPDVIEVIVTTFNVYGFAVHIEKDLTNIFINDDEEALENLDLFGYIAPVVRDKSVLTILKQDKTVWKGTFRGCGTRERGVLLISEGTWKPKPSQRDGS